MSGEYSTAKLPTGYTQVEYIQGTGTQYIDIGRKMYNNSEIELCFSFDVMQENCSIFGSRASSTVNNFEIASAFNTSATGITIYLDFGSYLTSRAAYNNPVINTKYICTISKSLRAVYDENRTLLVRNTNLISADNVTPSNALIFDTTGGYSKNKLKGKVYYCKIWENGVLVRNMIPCKNPSNVAGLYDTVNGAFYTNAGTGSFIAGAEVETVYGVIPVADYKDICDAVREKTHTDALMLPPEVAAKIRSINPTPTPGGWVRPEGWPDLDAVDLTGFDGVYLTYDLSKTEGYGWIGLFATTADQTSWTVERGHLEAGQFVAERTEQTASGGYFRESLDDTYGTIQLWRVSASGHITELKFVPLTATNSSNMNNNLQPCVERVGRLPYVVNFISDIGVSQWHRCCGTMWMQHDKMLDVSSVTDLQSAWQNCYGLQSLDLSGWNTSSVTNMAYAWQNCNSLQSINLSGWDVSRVAGMRNAWQYCYSLVDYLPPVIAINHSYSDAVELSIASLLRIVDSLPVVTGARTLTLGQNNKLKLTAEQIAVATQKGWTVA